MPLSPTHRSRPAVTALLLLTLAVLAVTVALALAGSGSVRDQGGGGTSSVRDDGSLAEDLADAALPWPEDGQTAVALEGRGTVGVRGDRRPVPIASLTKVMTAHVILSEHPLRPGEPGPLIEVDRQAAYEVGVGGESTVAVRAGDSYSERQLLEMLLIPSGNNIARLLARWDSGSQEAFVRKMQRAAGELGMDDTAYTGASGIEDTTTSTAEDQLRLARAVMENPVFRDIVASRTVSVPGVGELDNTNGLLGTAGVVGLKTGSSTPAGGNLLWASEVRVGDRSRLMLGAVLHQRANTTAPEGMRAALDNSRALIEGLRSRLASSATEA
ncbi:MULTISPECIES: D-alanyl-D-alanine carboxypeptidase family protein [unclassified Streptomyces]|uniref:D-alanyl-D-alanine carboxypeptidase family protein n=1 Tax=unclassified Streptomyces TaxID=2593676 RepID=UPI000F6E4F38|nr:MULTISPECIES: D-alanyl-D-alanine carboxypeptidase [unclassified Streptomyces]AZM58272.1 D-alanyl-D-alanine carboxypeptidase [Streptomyces sp. WAC 01438]RSM88781.1 D-alanyl-D-alanine carboxypeptidase [Streptomyces sp. WAC 01420]